MKSNRIAVLFTAMKRKNTTVIISIIVSQLLFSCAPVIRKDLMDMATRNVSLPHIQQNPDLYKGKLFVLGGIILSTKITAEGSLIEALDVAIDSRGYLKEIGQFQNRFLALFPKESGILDPLIFKRERQITFAGELIGTRDGKIDDMEYVYPLFRIKEIYLWEEPKTYYTPYPFYTPFPYWWNYPYYWWDRPHW